MDLSIIFFFILVGALTGTLAGLAGIGGGLVYVPVLVWYLENNNIPPDSVPLVSVSTSLAIIFFSIANGAYAHWKNGNLLISPMLYLVMGGIFGALGSSLMLTMVSSEEFKIFLGLFQLAVGIRILWPKNFSKTQGEMILPFPLILIGFFSGAISAFFGVGGGLIVTPLLHIFLRFRLPKAVGTSSGYMIFVAGISLVSYLIQSTSIHPLGEGIYYSVYLPAFLAILPTAFIFSRVGANLAHRFESRWFTLGFGVFILLIAIRNLVVGLI